MKKLDMISISLALVSVTYGSVAVADNGNSGFKWNPDYPASQYWQAPPAYKGFNRPPADAPNQPVNTQRRPNYYNENRRPTPPTAGYSNQRYQSQPAPNNTPPQYSNQRPYRQAPAAGPYGAYPPPAGPYNGGAYVPDNGASAFHTPGYNRYRDGRRNYNKFWGNSGPSRWMHPSKDNMEQGWDDMMNAPSRMGEMPGGWYAPEVSVPNPVDMADQVQDNVKDLPQQIRDMDVGNE